MLTDPYTKNFRMINLGIILLWWNTGKTFRTIHSHSWLIIQKPKNNNFSYIFLVKIVPWVLKCKINRQLKKHWGHPPTSEKVEKQ